MNEVKIFFNKKYNNCIFKTHTRVDLVEQNMEVRIEDREYQRRTF